jgi:hypothetical protein
VIAEVLVAEAEQMLVKVVQELLVKVLMGEQHKQVVIIYLQEEGARVNKVIMGSRLQVLMVAEVELGYQT